MLHLIEKTAERLLPPALHRALLQVAHKVRHRWRKWRKTPIAGVTIIITNKAREVMLLRHSYGPKAWGLPGGGLATGENPAECARRELREEVGLDVAELEQIGVLTETLSGSPHTSYVFAGEAAHEPRPDGREILEARFFAADALPELLTRNVPQRIAMWEAYNKES